MAANVTCWFTPAILGNLVRRGSARKAEKGFGRKTDLANMISKHDKTTFDELHLSAEKALEASAFNWISPSF
jgi:hypothetical protein